MKVEITHYKKDGINTVYENGKPAKLKTIIELPLKFGYDSYNQPMRILGSNINVEDIIEITNI